jgi:DMSO/TMAO reductase YedYZ heme-binding membrane subunit
VILGANLTWLVARSSGVVAWGLIIVSCTWGLLLATRALGRKPSPAWLLSLHRFLGALAVAFTGVHVLAIVVDSFIAFSVVDALVPFASSFRPLPVALGIVGMYLLVAIEVTSLARSRLSPSAWRRVHVLSYLLFATTTLHGITAGTDARDLLPTGIAFAVGATAVFLGGGLWWNRRSTPPGPSARRTPVSA